MHLMASQAAIPSASTGKAANLCLYPAEHDRYSMYIPTVYVAGMVLKLPLLSSKHCVSQSSLDTLSSQGWHVSPTPAECYQLQVLAQSCVSLASYMHQHLSTETSTSSHIGMCVLLETSND